MGSIGGWRQWSVGENGLKSPGHLLKVGIFGRKPSYPFLHVGHIDPILLAQNNRIDIGDVFFFKKVSGIVGFLGAANYLIPNYRLIFSLADSTESSHGFPSSKMASVGPGSGLGRGGGKPNSSLVSSISICKLRMASRSSAALSRVRA